MKKVIGKGKEVVGSGFDFLSEKIGTSIKVVKELIYDLPVIMSLERSSKADLGYDEKHYFVIPDLDSNCRFALHTMRSLPEGIPEVNELPKRRIFHLPHQRYETLLYDKIILDTKKKIHEESSIQQSTLEKLADDIDALDTKLTNGMLVIGGLASIFNPAVGLSIAAKAIIPGMAGLLSKYGIRPLGEKITKSQLESEVKKAEKKVLKEFSKSNTEKVINPLLSQLESILTPGDANGNDAELLDFGISQSHWKKLTIKAIQDVYEDRTSHIFSFSKDKLDDDLKRFIKFLSASQD